LRRSFDTALRAHSQRVTPIDPGALVNTARKNARLPALHSLEFAPYGRNKRKSEDRLAVQRRDLRHMLDTGSDEVFPELVEEMVAFCYQRLETVRVKSSLFVIVRRIARSICRRVSVRTMAATTLATVTTFQKERRSKNQ